MTAEEELREARDVVRRFLTECEHKGIDLAQVVSLGPNEMVLAPQGPVAPAYVGVDEELLIQLRDLVRKP
ncbi:MAG TPA: hypothetical protein VET26_00725 [Candidatus Sulfotelmatobacter sp.]|nr:hypothetical protein [Candidatus Sulfotelmatobacter sp.]